MSVNALSQSPSKTDSINSAFQTTTKSDSYSTSNTQNKYNIPRRTDLFALKTNLLYDALTALNIEVEVPIIPELSISCDFITPSWKLPSRKHVLLIRSGSLEFRYWFGNRRSEQLKNLTGWHIGLYGGIGLYDLRLNGRGYQGEFFDAGITTGYSHPIVKSGQLRLEYALAIGYLQTRYRYYIGMENNKYLVWQHDGRTRWYGPTKLEVSLVWLIPFRK